MLDKFGKNLRATAIVAGLCTDRTLIPPMSGNTKTIRSGLVMSLLEGGKSGSRARRWSPMLGKTSPSASSTTMNPWGLVLKILLAKALGKAKALEKARAKESKAKGKAKALERPTGHHGQRC